MIALALYNVPLIIASTSVMSKFVNPEDVDQNLYDKGLLQKEDPEIDVWFTEQKVPQLTFWVFVIVTLI